MNLRKRIALAKLNRTLLGASLPTPTHGNLNIIDNEVLLGINGSIKTLTIYFTGSIMAYNNLPEGYGFNIFKNKIVIVNFRGRGLSENAILFSFNGIFNPKRAIVRTFIGDKFKLEVFDRNKLDSLDISETKIEDETLILQYETSRGFKGGGHFNVSQVDDNSVRGLYTANLFGEEYSGYYNYQPDGEFYITEKEVSAKSKVLGLNVTTKDVRSVRKLNTLNKLVKNFTKKSAENEVNNLLVKPEDIENKKDKSSPSKRMAKTPIKRKRIKGGKY